MELYERLYKGEEFEFDLCAGGGVKFEKSKGYEYTTKETFIRKVSFKWYVNYFFHCSVLFVQSITVLNIYNFIS